MLHKILGLIYLMPMSFAMLKFFGESYKDEGFYKAVQALVITTGLFAITGIGIYLLVK